MTMHSARTANVTAPASVPVHRRLRAEAVSSAATSASWYESRKHIFVFTVIVAERKLREVERQIVFAHLVIAAHDAALQETPEGFQIVGMDLAAHVLMRFVIDVLMRKSLMEL